MSAVAAIFGRRPTEPNREQQARDAVRRELSGRVSQQTIAQAVARAVRAVVGGMPVDKAVRAACDWAYEQEPQPPAAA